LSGSYTGVTGVGTLTAGTWNATAIGAVYGGTGLTSYAVGDLVYADTTTSLAKLADVAVGNALISGGVGAAPSYGKIGLTTHVSGTLAAGNGGTGLTSAGTAGNVLTSNGSAWTSAAPSGFPSGTAMLFVQTAAPTGWTKSTTHDNKALRVVSGTASTGGSVAFTTAFASQGVSGSISSTTATNQAQTATNIATTATNQAQTATNIAGTVSGTVNGTTLIESQIPAHAHSGSTAGAGGHRHLIGSVQNNGPFGCITRTQSTDGNSWPNGTAVGDHTHSFTTNNTGGNGSHNHSFSGSSFNLTQNSHNHTQNSHNHTQDSHNHTQNAHTHTFTGTAINLAVQYVDVIICTKD
jgi:hypothetical protein